MDKETLSNYGWIVVCVLVLACMLALASPFGNFIAEGFKATYVSFWQGGNAAIGGVGNVIEAPPPSAEQLQSLYKFEYYSSVALAADDVSAGTIGENADCNKKDAVAGIYQTSDGKVNVVVLKSNKEPRYANFKKECTLNLNGCTLNYDDTSGGRGINVAEKITFKVDGRIEGSTINIYGTNLNLTSTIQSPKGGTLIIDGGTYTSGNSNGKQTTALQYIGNVDARNATFIGKTINPSPMSVIANVSGGNAGYVTKMENCTIKAIIDEGTTSSSQVCAVAVYDKSYFTNCTMEAYSIETGRTTSGISINGETYIKNCKIQGTHSGVSVQKTGIAYIDGGEYLGAQHGGIYACGSTIVKNALIGYKVDFKDLQWDISSAYFNAGFYASGSPTTSTLIYIDNCTIDNYGSFITLTTSQNAKAMNVYMSNTKVLDKDKKAQIHLARYHLYLGTGNNFTDENVSHLGFPMPPDDIRDDVSGSIHNTNESYANVTIDDIK